MSKSQQKRLKAILRHIGKASQYRKVSGAPAVWRDLLRLYPEVA